MNLKLRILQTLSVTHPQRYEKEDLQDQIAYQSRMAIGDGEMQRAVNELQTKGLIGYEIDDLTGDTRYYITDTGKAQVNR